MKKSKLLLASGIIGTLYLIYLISYFSGGVVSTDGAEAIGAGIAAALVTPHVETCVLLYNKEYYEKEVKGKVKAEVVTEV